MDYYINEQNVIDALVNLRQLTFEVTNSCNLKCRYCAFGDFYNGHGEHGELHLPTEKGKLLIDYLVKLWQHSQPIAYRPLTYISFYGGEPLLNMDFIRNIVAHVEGARLNREFRFSLTTNAVLLNRYMDYLVENNFRLLISLDGDRAGHSYRVDHSGNSSFDAVIANVKLLQRRYSKYFKDSVSFNAVLHNRNSVESIHHFIKDEFGKSPSISEISESGIRSEKRSEFNATYRSKNDSLLGSENYRKLSAELFMEEPKTADLLLFLHQYSGNVFRSYNEFFVDRARLPKAISGTCRPFEKKLFVTASGDILQCERIDHRFTLGRIDASGVVLNAGHIAAVYNGFLAKIAGQCSRCFRRESCIQCLYFIDNIEDAAPVCHGFMDKDSFDRYCSYCMEHLVRNPPLYQKLMAEVRVI